MHSTTTAAVTALFALLLLSLTVSARPSEIQPAAGKSKNEVRDVDSEEGEDGEEDEEEGGDSSNVRLGKVVKLLELFTALLHVEEVKNVESEAEFEAPFF